MLGKIVIQKPFYRRSRSNGYDIYHNDFGLIFSIIEKNDSFYLFESKNMRFVCMAEKSFDRFNKLFEKRITYYK